MTLAVETIFKELKVSLQTYKQHTGARQNCISCKHILRDLSGRFDPVLKRILGGKHPRESLRIPDVCLTDRTCACMRTALHPGVVTLCVWINPIRPLAAAGKL